MGASTSSKAYYKYLNLFLLMTQTTVLILTLRYSRTAKVDGPRYLSSTAIVLSEVVKIITCLAVLYKENKMSLRHTVRAIDNEAIKKPYESLKVAVPAVLYVVQNNLLFLALSHLDAATYQVTYQMKILTTAMFSVILLGKKLDGIKWLSLFLLTIGVAFVQMPSGQNDKPNILTAYDKTIGFTCIVFSCLSSGFSGVYFEKILKTTNTSVWMRNLQLAFFSIWFGFGAVFFSDFELIKANGFFQGYNALVWFLIVLQACGGLIIGLVVKYADNILKGFATSLSIILSSILSYFLLGDFEPSL
uniref:UDP-N-acetylglucosamine transporter n=1 Tax=Romanomermis culicivorax TaxID=13658 RepID=A0A915KEF8_ROMCU